ncbi:NAD(P)-binding domain-containing protein [Mesorhizobium sp. BR1-1-16]|uniref:NADPH-dependent F420 reductase n=1 Tax=Mesorhizobium sp. BR1-1-16 TaxID=2876653 RepID=UPI001CCF416A|nr:NAD(P)-binding domain-containing protein [Mesorhizobium sp. BR1-1-16]MBZ9937779.1 NAD(P)-binding domain-containing protein [Mesorhizobium sp. BR1-1-16]
MKFGVLGTGEVGSAIGGKLMQLGHDVVIGSRQPGGDKARALGARTGAGIGSYREAAAHAEWVFNALPGEEAIGILRGCAIDDKILIDIANYNSAVDQPIVTPIGEAIQAAFPRARLVKTLNSVSAHLMVEPTSLGRPHHVFVASNDISAKSEVTELLRSFGWASILDLGDLTACRAMEQLIPLWMRLEEKLGTTHFNLAVVHDDASPAA